MGYKIKASELAEILSVGRPVVTQWMKDGMPCEKVKNAFYFDVLEALLWHGKNINGSPLRDIFSEEDDMSVEDQLRVKRMDKLDLDMAIQRGEYIPIEEVDNTTSGMVALLISHLRQNMRVLPKLLAKKTESQVKKALDSEYEKTINEIQKTLIEEYDAHRE